MTSNKTSVFTSALNTGSLQFALSRTAMASAPSFSVSALDIRHMGSHAQQEACENREKEIAKQRQFWMHTLPTALTPTVFERLYSNPSNGVYSTSIDIHQGAETSTETVPGTSRSVGLIWTPLRLVQTDFTVSPPRDTNTPVYNDGALVTDYFRLLFAGTLRSDVVETLHPVVRDEAVRHFESAGLQLCFTQTEGPYPVTIVSFLVLEGRRTAEEWGRYWSK